MTSQVSPVADLEELFANEIPCGGTTVPQIMDCPGGRAAQLRANPHGSCGSNTPSNRFFKCEPCYQLWRAGVTRKIAKLGFVRCLDCGQLFASAEDFCEYRRF